LPKNIKISILIVNYNKQTYIKRCLNSCINQSFLYKYEIIFIDDNSQDKSLETAKLFSNSVKIFKTKKKKQNKFNTFHQINSYLKAINKAKGEILCFLDSDDFFKRNKLQTIYNQFLKNTNLQLVFDKPIIFFNKNKKYFSNYNYRFRFNKWPKFPPQSCISVKKEFLNEIKEKIFPKQFPTLSLDFRIAAEADKFKNNVLFLNKYLTFYYQDLNGETNKNFRFFRSNWWLRRKEAFNYYENINFIKIRDLDYYLTKFLTFFIKR
jgi:glycosyltransferase involved in cell wall biosynthesis